MKRLVLLLAIAPPFCLAQPAPAKLDLHEAIERALAQPSPEDAEVAVAKARVLWVQAAGKRRIEIKPQTALWTFVNPLALATNLGAGILGASEPASPLTVLDAKIDLASAETAARARRFEREVEVTEQFNALALRQQMAERSCQAVGEAEEQRDRVEREVRFALSTSLDVLWQEQTVLDRKVECRMHEQDRAIAAAALSATTQRDPGDVEVTTTAFEPMRDSPVQSPEALYKLALLYRSDVKAADPLQEEIANLWDELEDIHGPQALRSKTPARRCAGSSATSAS